MTVGTTGWATESHRVASLPIEDQPVAEQRHSDAERWTARTATRTGSWRLTPVQGAALEEMHQARGLLGAIGCGHGKTLIGLLAGRALDCELVIYLAPSVLVGNVERAATELCEHFRLTRVRVVAYEALSSARHYADSEHGPLGRALGTLEPGQRAVVVCDEAHRLKSSDSARTRRVMRFARAHPEVRWVVLSGTMATRSVMDFARLAELALRDQSPVPRDRTHLESWARVTDHKPEMEPDKQDYARIWPLRVRMQRAGELEPPSPREAVGRRLACTRGVVVTGDASTGASLCIEVRKLPTDPAVKQALEQLELGTLPDGDPPQNPEAVVQAGRQLCAGYYLRWDWPGGVIDHDWLEARRAWAWYVRRELEHRAGPGYESPLQVEQRTEAAGDELGRKLLEAWQAARVRPQPPQRVTWVSTWLVDRVVEHLEDCGEMGDPCLVWYESPALADHLEARGVTVYRAGQAVPEGAAHSCAVSTLVHSDGANLQAWRRSLVVEPPSSGKRWEQLLSRTHRQGQTADEVLVEVWLTAWPTRRAWSDAKRSAAFIRDTTGNPQRLLFADVVEVEH